MAATAGKRMRVQTHGGDQSDEITLPVILDRLSRLENGGFSYDELLHDFASRRRVGPVNKEIAEKRVVDPAEETDVVVKVRGLERLTCSSTYYFVGLLCRVYRSFPDDVKFAL